MASDTGIGIAIDDVSALKGVSEILDYACMRFKYISLYSSEMNKASEIADRIFIRYGLPITVLSTDEFTKCRHPVKVDFGSGKLRLGRDMCIVGTDAEGNIIRG